MGVNLFAAGGNKIDLVMDRYRLRNRYRVSIGSGYNGCIPITVYWVEVRERGFFGDKWRKIKGFDTKARAIELLNMLKGK